MGVSRAIKPQRSPGRASTASLSRTTMQRALLFFAILALTVACALAQTRPKLATTFETHGIIQIKHNHSVVFGEGRWIFDLEAGKSLDWAHFGGFEHLGVYDLARFELKKNYFISSADARKCEEKDLTEKIRSPWEWLDKAELVGNLTRNGVLFDLWQYKTAGVKLEAGVPQNNTTELVYFSRTSVREEFHFYVEQWRTNKPHQSWFEVPHECKKAF